MHSLQVSAILLTVYTLLNYSDFRINVVEKVRHCAFLSYYVAKGRTTLHVSECSDM